MINILKSLIVGLVASLSFEAIAIWVFAIGTPHSCLRIGRATRDAATQSRPGTPCGTGQKICRYRHGRQIGRAHV